MHIPKEDTGNFDVNYEVVKGSMELVRRRKQQFSKSNSFPYILYNKEYGTTLPSKNTNFPFYNIKNFGKFKKDAKMGTKLLC